MNNISLTVIGNEDELSTQERIEIYKETIRLLEKDIDTIRTANSREGWNTWAILGAITAAGLLIIGQTKDLAEVPTDLPKISGIFIVIFQTIITVYNVSLINTIAKERRLISAKDIHRGRSVTAVYKIITIAIAAWLLFISDIPNWLKILSISFIFIPVAQFLLTLFTSKRFNMPVGNNPQTKKGFYIGVIISLLSFIIPTVLLSQQLSFPLGAKQSAAYVIGLCFSAIVILFQFLMTNTDYTALTDLQNLKDDLIFNRLSITETLMKYQVMKEGKSLYDEMQPEYNELLGYLNRESEIYTEQEVIIDKFEKNLIEKGDSESTVSTKLEDQNLLFKAIRTYSAELASLHTIISEKIPIFTDKLNKAAAASGDHDTEEQIDILIKQRFQELIDKAERLEQKKTLLDKKIKDRVNQN